MPTLPGSSVESGRGFSGLMDWSLHPGVTARPWVCVTLGQGLDLAHPQFPPRCDGAPTPAKGAGYDAEMRQGMGENCMMVKSMDLRVCETWVLIPSSAPTSGVILGQLR